MKYLVFCLIVLFCIQSKAQLTSPTALQGLTAVPTTGCDQRYALEMDRILRQLQGSISQDRVRLAREYMIMIKQHQDLDFRIQTMERRTLNVVTVARLRAPLTRYQRCQDRAFSQTRARGQFYTASTLHCDQEYTLALEQIPQLVRGALSQNRLAAAKEYMIMVKQRQDLDFKTRQMERNTFNTTVANRLRSPLQQYQRCRTAVSTRRVPL